MLGNMTGLNQDQFDALHIGKYEGEQAAKVSTSYNKVGVMASQVGVTAGKVGVAAGGVG
jgi:hypothetical protein